MPFVILSEAAHAAAEPTALGFDAAGWVALAMIAVFAVLIWKKVPALIGAMLDKQIAEIRRSLDEAATLRKEAEALRSEYAAKIKGAETEAETLLSNARREADSLVSKAEEDTKALIIRRNKMAEEKIAAAERAAIAHIRAKAASAAALAAESLIAQKHDATADKALVDQAIAGLGSSIN
jgi:F-type H+-transporting ATPase subunit b